MAKKKTALRREFDAWFLGLRPAYRWSLKSYQLWLAGHRAARRRKVK